MLAARTKAPWIRAQRSGWATAAGWLKTSAGAKHAEEGVVEHDEADGDEERPPVLVEGEDADHDEEVEVGFDEAAREVHDDGRGQDEADGGHGGGGLAAAVGGGQDGADGDDSGLGAAVERSVPPDEAEGEDHHHMGPQQPAEAAVAETPYVLGEGLALG